MPRKLTLLPVLLLMLIPIAWQVQQESPQRAAERVLREVFDAHEKMQWGRIVLLLHPDALTYLRQGVLSSLEAMERSKDEPVRNPPDMPECVAQYFEEQRAKHQDDFPIGLKAYGVATLDELRALSTEELTARWLEVQDERTQMMHGLSAQKPAVLDSLRRVLGDSAFLAQMPQEKRTVVGSIVENDSTIQVLYRTRYSDDPREGPDSKGVAVMRRSGRDWRLLPGEGGLFNENGFVGVSIAEMHNVDDEIQKLSKEIVSWDGKKVAAGRAYLTGFGDSKEEQALVIQVGRDRVRVPRSAFGDIGRLLEMSYMAPQR